MVYVAAVAPTSDWLTAAQPESNEFEDSEGG